MNIAQRFRDWRHERYISRLRGRLMAAANSRDRIMARVYWTLFTRAIIGRSHSQKLRMERRFMAGLDDSSLRVYEAHRVPAGDL